MYTYRRFKTSKWSLTIILTALAVVTWGILGLTGTPLAKKPQEATIDVHLELDPDGPEAPELAVPVTGTSGWKQLHVKFSDQPAITVLIDDEPKILYPHQMCFRVKRDKGNRIIVKVLLAFLDTDENWYETGWMETYKQIPPEPGYFELPIGWASIYRGAPKGKNEPRGTVYIGDAVFTP